MNHAEILACVDHTLLSQTATWPEIQALCDDALKYRTASVCIPPSCVKQARTAICSGTRRMTASTISGSIPPL